MRLGAPGVLPDEGVFALLLDLDEGPARPSRAGNEAFYTDEGLERLEMALRPGGVLGLWSPSRELELTSRMGSRFVNVAEVVVPVDLPDGTMNLDYVTLARTKGYGETRVILREALRNAALPTLTLVGVQFTFLIGGTVIIERLFSYEGLGNMAIDAVINRDLPLIQGIVLLFAAIFTAVNLIVDLLYAVLNPRLRHA